MTDSSTEQRIIKSREVCRHCGARTHSILGTDLGHSAADCVGVIEGRIAELRSDLVLAEDRAWALTPEGAADLALCSEGSES